MLNKQNEKIFVDLDDEITFVVERVKNSTADRIILVAPDGASVISSLVSLRLLSKLVFKIGKSLVLVTMDEGGKKFAQKAGIPCVGRVAEVSEDHWLQSETALKKRGVHPILGKKEIVETPVVEANEAVLEREAELVEEALDETKDDLEADLAEDVVEEEVVEEKKSLADTVIPIEEAEENREEKESVPEEDELAQFGFVVDKDILEEEKGEESLGEEFDSYSEMRDDVLEAPEAMEDEIPLVGRDMSGVKLKEPMLDKINIKGMFKNLKMPKLKFSAKGVLPLILIIIFLLATGGIYAYFVAPTAAIELVVKHEEVLLNREVIATTEVSDVDIEGLKIPLILQESEDSGSESGIATGTETRGEKAKGKVTIVNKVEDVIELGAGTVLFSSELEYVLVSNVEIEAAVYAFESRVYGKIEVDVEAYDIGEEYNLDIGETFTVEGYTISALEGRNYDVISGGTKEDVTIVTAGDRDAAKNTLEDRLKDSAINKLKGQISEGYLLNDAMITTEITQESYDAEVGDEKDSFDLNMTVKAKGYVYSQEDVNTVSWALLDQSVISGTKLDKDNSSVSTEFLREESGKAVVKINATGILIGEIDEENLIKGVSGKKPSELEELLGNVEGVTGYEYELGPTWLPGWMKHVPTMSSKISLEITIGDSAE